MRARLLALAIAFVAASASAQPDPTKAEVKVERIAPGVAVLFGQGGNIGLSYGEDGNIIIDDQYAPMTEAIVAAVASLDPDPLRFVINTHWHGDHTGGNENLGKRGVVIVAHDNVRKRMSTEQFMKVFNQRIPASHKAALASDHLRRWRELPPQRRYAARRAHRQRPYRRRFGGVLGEEQRRSTWATSSFTNSHSPSSTATSGGSLAGLIAALDKLLPMVKPDTKIIPGHGAVAARQDLVAYRAMLVDIRDKVAAGIGRGQTLAQILGFEAGSGLRDGRRVHQARRLRHHGL